MLKRLPLFSLLAFLFLLVACGSGADSQATQVSTPRPHPTPTQSITPTPTIPDVPSRMVFFQTPDHIILGGLLYGQGKTVVICSHELRTSKAIWSLSGIPQRLVTRGYEVLAYDFRGNGASQGPPDVSKIDVDLKAAITFARQQGATKIVLLGSSMGGTATLKVASDTRVDAVISLSAPQNFSISLSDADIKAISAPKLFINSENDDYASDTMHMYEVANAPKELHLYPGAAHGTSIFDTDNGVDLTQRILDFVTRYAPAS